MGLDGPKLMFAEVSGTCPLICEHVPYSHVPPNVSSYYCSLI